MPAKVGKIAATLVFFLVVEAQRRVNVNVHINITNSGSGSATGHIEGQNLPPRARATGEIRSGIYQEQGKEDCGAFFIADCANQLNSPRDTILVPARDQEACQKSCAEGTLLNHCKSFLWRADETSGNYTCFNSRKSMKNLVLDQCNTFYGKVGGEDEHALDSCIDGKTGQCRPGDCNDVVSHLGDEIPTKTGAPIKTKNEVECKQACFSMGVCKYYTWDQITLICKPYKGASSTVSATVTCHARAGNKKSECTKGCQYISEWSEWSQCSPYECGVPSTQVRTRTKVENGNDCPTSETQPCQHECAPCPDGWIPDKEGKFGCFHFGNEDQLMSWNDAKEFCSGLHQSSRLVESCSKDMNDAITEIFPHDPTSGGDPNGILFGWVGVYQDAGGEPWKWASTGSALTPEDFDWRVGEPNNAQGNENCVEMRKILTSGKSGRLGLWNDNQCESDWKRYPICHYPCDATQQVHRNHFYPNISAL